MLHRCPTPTRGAASTPMATMLEDGTLPSLFGRVRMGYMSSKAPVDSMSAMNSFLSIS